MFISHWHIDGAICQITILLGMGRIRKLWITTISAHCILHHYWLLLDWKCSSKLAILLRLDRSLAVQKQEPTIWCHGSQHVVWSIIWSVCTISQLCYIFYVLEHLLILTNLFLLHAWVLQTRIVNIFSFITRAVPKKFAWPCNIFGFIAFHMMSSIYKLCRETIEPGAGAHDRWSLSVINGGVEKQQRTAPSDPPVETMCP